MALEGFLGGTLTLVNAFLLLAGDYLATKVQRTCEVRRTWRALWQEAGYPDGFEVMVLYSIEDKALAKSADRIWAYLAEHGLKADRLEVASGEVDAMVEEFTAGGVSVLWLERQ